MELLVINGHDYSKFIKRKGYGWSRNDLDSDKSTRTKDGLMRRVKIATKRKITYDVIGMTRAEIAQLDDDLSETTFNVTYMDLHGKRTGKFYCANFSADLNTITTEAAGSWEAASFNITEV